MKKILVRICIALIVLIVLVALGVHFFLDGAIKRGVETVGPKLTKTEVKLGGVHLSLLSGSGKIKGLSIGNPDPYKTPHAIAVGTATLEVKPGSLFSDKVVIHSINMESPEITFEGGLSGNNLSKILANLNEATSGGTNVANATPSEQKKANKKLQVDDFAITGAKLNANITDMGGKTLTITLPPIHLTGLGTGPDGITVAELTKKVIAEIEKQSVKAVSEANLGKVAENLTKGLGTNTSGTVSNVTRGLGNLFNKK
jgi:uncharacterized protein involved in outer membrane biogenesis